MRFFITFDSQDQLTAQPIMNALLNEGQTVWQDQGQQRLPQSDYCLYLFSSFAQQNAQVQQVIQMATRLQTPLIVIQLDLNPLPDTIPYMACLNGFNASGYALAEAILQIPRYVYEATDPAPTSYQDLELRWILHNQTYTRRFTLDANPIIIGRSEESDISLAHPTISRTHASIYMKGDQRMIINLSQKNRVYLEQNGEKVTLKYDEEAVLENGMTFRLSDVYFEVLGEKIQPNLNTKTCPICERAYDDWSTHCNQDRMPLWYHRFYRLQVRGDTLHLALIARPRPVSGDYTLIDHSDTKEALETPWQSFTDQVPVYDYYPSSSTPTMADNMPWLEDDKTMIDPNFGAVAPPIDPNFGAVALAQPEVPAFPTEPVRAMSNDLFETAPLDPSVLDRMKPPSSPAIPPVIERPNPSGGVYDTFVGDTHRTGNSAAVPDDPFMTFAPVDNPDRTLIDPLPAQTLRDYSPTDQIAIPPVRKIGQSTFSAPPRVTAFFPTLVQPQQQYAITVFVHVEAALAQIRRVAQQQSPLMGNQPPFPEANLTAGGGSLITINLTLDKIQPTRNFNVVSWYDGEDGQPYVQTTFLFQTPLNLQQDVVGKLTLYQNILLIGEIPIYMKRVQSSSSHQTFGMEAELDMIIPIFPCYAADDPIVSPYIHHLAEQDKWFQQVVEARARRDTLQLHHMVGESSAFQLFWNENTAQSGQCHTEWNHAAELEGRYGRFIRAVFWGNNIVPPPPELQGLPFQKVFLPS